MRATAAPSRLWRDTRCSLLERMAQINIDITRGDRGTDQHPDPRCRSSRREVPTSHEAIRSALSGDACACSAYPPAGPRPRRTLVSQKPDPWHSHRVNTNELRDLPPPQRKLDVAVFAFHRSDRPLPAEQQLRRVQLRRHPGRRLHPHQRAEGCRAFTSGSPCSNAIAWPDLFQERQIIRANRAESVRSRRPADGAASRQLRNAGSW